MISDKSGKNLDVSKEISYQAIFRLFKEILSKQSVPVGPIIVWEQEIG
jgi:hypothetical protein